MTYEDLQSLLALSPTVRLLLPPRWGKATPRPMVANPPNIRLFEKKNEKTPAGKTFCLKLGLKA
ncbi:MAG: hypothetical protein D6722_10070 [Bacteroidetes bacterium]|nr:MAG: hypothetical protein D6722_10070 [Bacteroidota bacterium]